MNIDRVLSIADEENMLMVKGFDEAILGIASRSGQEDVIAYSAGEIISILMNREKMTYSEAKEYYTYNIEQSWCGPMTPVFVDGLDWAEYNIA